MHCTLETFIPSSLFNGMDKNKFNFFGLEKFCISLNLRQTYGRLFSMIKPTGSTTHAAFHVQRLEFEEPPVLHTMLYTPPPFIADNMKNQDGSVKPYLIGYSHLEEVANAIVPGPVAAKTTKTSWSYNSISCPCLPKRLYISVISNPDEPYIVPDTDTTNRETLISYKSRAFARIDSCILTINGTRSLVSATSRDLFRMSVENGLNLSSEEALYTAGSPIVVDLRKDCSLSGMLVGNSDSVNIGVDLDFTNLDPTSANHFKLYVIAEYDAVLKHDKGTFSYVYSNVASNISNLSMSDIKSREPYYWSRQGIYLGGSILGKIRDGLGWVLSKAPEIGSAIKTGVDMYRSLRGGKNDVVGGSRGGKNDVVGGATLKDSRFK